MYEKKISCFQAKSANCFSCTPHLHIVNLAVISFAPVSYELLAIEICTSTPFPPTSRTLVIIILTIFYLLSNLYLIINFTSYLVLFLNAKITI